MKRYLSFAVVLLFLSGMFAVHADTRGNRLYMEHTKIKWRSYSKDIFIEARRQKKPIYIFIYADWCKWCQKFEVETLETAAIRQRLNNNFVPVAMNYDKQKSWQNSWGPKWCPRVYC